MKTLKSLLVVLTLALLPAIAIAQTSSSGPMVGKWKLNLAKSDFGEGSKPQGMLVEVTSDTPEAVAFNVTETAENGMMFTYKFKGPADGKEHPAEGISTLYAYTEEGGVVTETQKDTDGTITKGTFALSANGKIGTWTYTITDPQGAVTHTKQVYDRVQ